MTGEERKGKEMEMYSKPRILATYNKEELEEAIQPHGQLPDGGCTTGGGCGCGCGSVL
jgi:hypothetical protein